MWCRGRAAIEGVFGHSWSHEASQKKLDSRAALPDPLVLAPMTDKVKRTQIHQFFKRHFFLPTDNIAISVEAKKEAEKNSQNHHPAFACITLKSEARSAVA